jgi:hypothetical protein
MIKCCVLFEVRTEFLNIINAGVGFIGINVGDACMSEFLSPTAKTGLKLTGHSSRLYSYQGLH